MTTPRIDNLNSYNNMIIGGNFDFWQRGTSFTAVANNAYTADRWQYTKVGAMVGNITRSTDVPTVAQSGFASQFSLLYTITTVDSSIAAGEVSLLNYKIEGSNYALIHGGQSARLQFWVKSSVTGTYGVALRNNAVNRSYVTTIAINAANTWERKTIDFTTDTAGTWLLDNSTGLQISIVLDSGTDFRTSTLNSWQNGNFVAGSTQANFSATNGATFQLAQVMLVPGSFASTAELTFKRAGRTIQQELQMCQRYYVQPRDLGDRPLVRMHWYDTNAIYFIYQPPVQLRAHPTIINAASYTVYTLNITAQTGFSVAIQAGPLTNSVYFSASKLSHGLTDAVLHIANVNAGLDAEL
jgi:hypothetical protein